MSSGLCWGETGRRDGEWTAVSLLDPESVEAPATDGQLWTNWTMEVGEGQPTVLRRGGSLMAIEWQAGVRGRMEVWWE